MTAATTSAKCPGLCGGKCNGEMVAVKGAGSKTAKTVRFAPCTVLIAQGWNNPIQVALTQAQYAASLKA